jgi:hemolysin III
VKHLAPHYSPRERAADAAVQLCSVVAALMACLALVLLAPWPARPRPSLALLAYTLGLLAMTGCSALYHLAAPGRAKAWLRRLDHAAIFAMIAGTYTPVALLGIGGAWGVVLLAVVWAGAAGGAALKLFAPARFERISVLAYLLLGWAGVAALQPLLAALPTRDLLLILAGGMLYSLGVVVHLSTRLPYHNAIWHGLVLAAAGCHYAVVFRLLTGIA